MEKKLVKEINIKVNSNQKKIRGSIFLPNTNLKKNNIVKSGQKISGKISFHKKVVPHFGRPMCKSFMDMLN